MFGVETNDLSLNISIIKPMRCCGGFCWSLIDKLKKKYHTAQKNDGTYDGISHNQKHRYFMNKGYC